jgi:hypothetical protein
MIRLRDLQLDNVIHCFGNCASAVGWVKWMTFIETAHKACSFGKKRECQFVRALAKTSRPRMDLARTRRMLVNYIACKHLKEGASKSLKIFSMLSKKVFRE